MSNELPFKSLNLEKQFPAITLEEFLAKELPVREIILDPWLPTQGLAMLYAPRGVGKTYFALYVAFAVVTGTEFLKWKATRPRSVLYLDGEMPANVLQERLAHIVAASDKEPCEALKIITPDLMELGVPDLADCNDQAILEREIEGVDLIIVDNISTLCRNGRENEAEGWLPIQEWALQQRAKGRTVLFIHHAGKGGAQRGTSKREDVLDTIINLRHPSDYTHEQGALFEIHFEKSRGFFGEAAKPLHADLTADDCGKLCWLVKDIEESNLEKVAQLLNNGLKQKEIVDELGISKGHVSRLAKRAKEEGKII